MSLINAVGQLATAKEAYDLPQSAIDAARAAGEGFKTGAAELATQAGAATEFQPFSVRTATGGGTDVTAGGDVTQTLGTSQQAIAENLLGQAQTASGQAPVTAQSLFDQMQAMRSGETERQRLALENRLAAQGRLGVQTGAFGGTPEAFALEKALQEQQSQDLLQAMQLAPQLQGQQLQNIQGMLSGAFMPEQQQLATLQAVTPIQSLVQSARQGESQALTNLGMAGLEAQAGAETGVANIEAARARAFGDALQGLFAIGEGKNESIADKALDQLPDWLKGVFGG